MTENKIQDIIAQKNRALEDRATREAAEIIDEIAQHQSAILDHNARIDALRSELKSLQIEQLDATKILG